jgi:hypothetical protein
MPAAAVSPPSSTQLDPIKGKTMKRLLGVALLATTALTATAYAAPPVERVRGTVQSVSADSMTVKPMTGSDITVALNGGTKYLSVVKSSLSEVAKGSFIGTATKGSGADTVALEVVVFPPAMNGTGEGHYPWDELPDPTAGGSRVSSAMTNGTVAAASAPMVKSAMTNGTVQSASSASGDKRITVTYKGGQQSILVPPSAPIVTFVPGSHALVVTGAHVFVRGTSDNGTITAQAVAVGKDGLTPPM